MEKEPNLLVANNPPIALASMEMPQEKGITPESFESDMLSFSYQDNLMLAVETNAFLNKQDSGQKIVKKKRGYV